MLRTLLILLAVVACKKTPPTEPVDEAVEPTRPAELPPPGSQHAPPGTTVTAERPPPDLAALQGLARRLSIKDPAPDCAELAEGMSADPEASFHYVVNTVQTPPWAPMRAAGCILELYPESSKDAIVGWVRTKETEGLGRLVLSKLATLPEPVAVGVVKAGLGSDLAEETREAAAASERQAVRDAATE